MQEASTITGLETLPDYARILAKFGRFEDTYIVHAAEGETVVPMEVFEKNPALKEMLFSQMRDMGIEPERYIVGNELNSLNPVTGQPEFFLKKLWKGVKKVLKVAAPVIGAVAGSFIPIPVVGPMIGSFVASKIAGYDTKSALMGAAASGIGAYALGGSAAAAMGGYTGGIGGTSLGQALYGGLSQAPSFGAGLQSLVTSAPAAVGNAPSSVSAVTGAAEKLAASGGAAGASGTGAATGSAFLNGSIAQPLFNFAKNNPGLLLAGGSALMSLLDKPEKVEPSLVDTTTGQDLINQNPGAYAIDTSMPSVNYLAAAQPAGDYSQVPALGTPATGSLGVNFPVFSPYYQPQYVASGGHISGPGTGTSDSIPAMLSDGEFVMTAKAVRGAGKGDRKKGARKMYALMKQYEALANG